MYFRIQKVIHKLQRAFHILTADADAKSVGNVRIACRRRRIIVSGGHALVDNDVKRYICTSFQALGLDGIFCALVIPALIDHSQHTAGGKGCDIRVIARSKGFRIDDAVLIHLIQDSIILMSGFRGVVVHYNRMIRIFGIVHDRAAIVRIPIQEQRHVLQSEISPVICTEGEANIRSLTVRHGRIFFQISSDQIEILVDRIDFRISCPLQHSGLDPPSFSAMVIGKSAPLIVAELRDDVDVSVFRTHLIPLGF